MERSDARAAVPWPAATAVLVPSLVPLIGAIVIVIGWALGADPFWRTPDINVSEAAAVRDHAEVVRLIERGADPNRRWPVRSDVIDSQPHTMTPLEAAVETRRLDLVRLLVRHGARVTPDVNAALTERASAVGANDLVEYFGQLASEPPGTSR